MTKKYSNKQTLYSLQFLRAFAVILVIFSHIRHKQDTAAHYGFQWLEWFNFGEYGVDIFFVISGFIIAYISPKARHSLLDVFNFMMKRIFRIMPLYYTVTLIALCVWFIQPELVNSSSPSSTVILPSFFLWPTEGRFLFQSGWTLSYEMYFYLIFGFTLLLARWQYRILSTFLVISLFIGILVPIQDPVLKLMTSHHLAEFLGGYLFYKLAHKQIGAQVYLGMTMIGVGVTFLLSHALITNSFLLSLYVWGFPAMMIVFGFLLSEGHYKIPNLFLKLGDSSYSIYLTHALALPVLTKIWYSLAPQTSNNTLASIGNLGFILFSLGATLLIGVIVFHIYEKPLGKKINRWWGEKYAMIAASSLLPNSYLTVPPIRR